MLAVEKQQLRASISINDNKLQYISSKSNWWSAVSNTACLTATHPYTKCRYYQSTQSAIICALKSNHSITPNGVTSATVIRDVTQSISMQTAKPVFPRRSFSRGGARRGDECHRCSSARQRMQTDSTTAPITATLLQHPSHSSSHPCARRAAPHHQRVAVRRHVPRELDFRPARLPRFAAHAASAPCCSADSGLWSLSRPMLLCRTPHQERQGSLSWPRQRRQDDTARQAQVWQSQNQHAHAASKFVPAAVPAASASHSSSNGVVKCSDKEVLQIGNLRIEANDLGGHQAGERRFAD